MWWQTKEVKKLKAVVIPGQLVKSDERLSQIVAVTPLPITVPQHVPPPVINIPSPAPQRRLSDLLEAGRQLHPLCRNAFVERVEMGFYAYEKRTEWRTCALAAIYAALFGAASIQRPDFSYTQAVWRVSQRVGWGIGERMVVGPTGRRNNVADEMIKLIDENLWSRATVAEWLASEGM